MGAPGVTPFRDWSGAPRRGIPRDAGVGQATVISFHRGADYRNRYFHRSFGGGSSRGMQTLKRGRAGSELCPPGARGTMRWLPRCRPGGSICFVSRGKRGRAVTAAAAGAL